MSFGPLVDVDWLRAAVGRPELCVAACRWKLGDPRAGRAAYLAGHIPGAAFLDLERDLSGPPGERGRHPLPEAAEFERSARRAGIGEHSEVGAYDEGGESGAPRLW